jgi:sodium transport system ATP-binding protein
MSLTDPGEVRRRVGFLATSTALYGRLTAREMITYFGRLHGLSPEVIRERTQRLADELDMHEFLDRRCDSFSTGMKQKTSIARTLIHDPGGDDLRRTNPRARCDGRAFDRTLRARLPRTGQNRHLFDPCDESRSKKLCDLVGIIHDGRVVAEGTVAALRARFGGDDLEDAFVRAVGAEPPVINPGRSAGMSWANIVTIYLKELRDSLRDRRTLISTIVMPTLIMPLLMLERRQDLLQGA